MSDWVWAQGDTNPLLQTLRDAAGAAVDIQGVAGSAIKLTVTPIRGATPIISAANMTNLQVGDGSDGTKGRVSYTPTTETATAGDYLGRIKLTTSGLTFPNDGYILITITPVAPVTEGRYLTREELKKTANLTGASYADADIDVALEAASRGLETAYSARWIKGTPGETRYYTRSSDREVTLGDVLAVTAVALDYGAWSDIGPGGYSTVLPGTDYRLLPIEAGLAGNGEPYRTLQLDRGSVNAWLPTGVDAIRITGTFGWNAIPAGVKIAVSIIALRLLQRTREAPFGIIQVGPEGSFVRAGQIARDPEVAFAMQGATPPRSLLV